jgi:7-carboxy-7-deazaguanine synthase
VNLPMIDEPKKTFLNVSEMYTGVSQGEGPTLGQPCSFVRFTACHRQCSWCDSSFTWKKGEIITSKKTPEEVFEFLESGPARKVILTGGEPLLQQDTKGFNKLLDLLEKSYSWNFEIETEGLFVPNQRLQALAREDVLRINCSPKLKLAGMGDLTHEYAESQGLETIAKLPGSCFKFVVSNEDDVIEALEMLGVIFGIARNGTDVVQLPGYLRKKVYLMPEGVTRQVQLERLPIIHDLALKYNVGFTPRLHVLRWDDKKGV